ncbi:hypothetical protein [Acutalibacter muris]|jgi:hypothetical protein|uniref:hypothetical protein n=1 Tax=Acutalibacter muris TaxID=1796620 RepID=UPI0026F3F602|nr:hypothetical protein [Acutalibacter muris]
MKDEIMQRLIAAVNALNTIPVSGKQNLANLSGSINVIEEVLGMLDGADIVQKAAEKAKGK